MNAPSTSMTRSTTVSTPRQGVWRRRIHPLLLDRVMDTAETRSIRDRVCAGLAGDVLEIGAGTGLNLAHLPAAVRRVLAVEPLQRGRELAGARMSACHATVDHVGDDARSLPLVERSVDAVLCTWSLCSIDDPHLAVAEISRVMRPGGELHFVEHGRADDPGVRRWQHRCDRLWSRLTCGCHLDRDIVSIIEGGGLRVTNLATYFTESEPKILGWTFEGRATVR